MNNSKLETIEKKDKSLISGKDNDKSVTNKKASVSNDNEKDDKSKSNHKGVTDNSSVAHDRSIINKSKNTITDRDRGSERNDRDDNVNLHSVANLNTSQNEIEGTINTHNNLVDIQRSIEREDNVNYYAEDLDEELDRVEGNIDVTSSINRNRSKHNTRIEIDAEEVEDKKGRIFMTENQIMFDNKELFSFHDLIVPGGKNARLVNTNITV